MKAILVTLLLSVAIASADPKRAQAVADAATELFKKDDFTGAAKKFEEAYALARDPGYLFNIAQAYRQAGDCVRAADYYGRFLSEVPHPPNEDKIRVWYASQMQCAKERAATTEPPKQEPPKQEPPKQEPPKQEPPKQESPRQELPPPPPKEQGGPRTGLALALVGTGVAALAVGGFFAWDVQYLEDQRRAVQMECTTERRCSAARINDYDRRGARANALMIG